MDPLTLREHFGLSQSQLAAWTEINVSCIKMAETGKRKFDWSQMPLYKQLVQIAQATPSPAEQAPSVPNTTVQQINSEVALLRLHNQQQAIQHQWELDAVKKSYQQALNRKYILQLRKRVLGYVHQQEAWLEKLLHQTEKQIQENSLAKQALLQMKIDIASYITQKATVLEQQLAAIGAEE